MMLLVTDPLEHHSLDRLVRKVKSLGSDKYSALRRAQRIGIDGRDPQE